MDIASTLRRAAGRTTTITAGVHLVSHPLSWPSDATIFGYGATIQMAPDFPANTPLFIHRDAQGNAITVNGLRVFGLNVRGNDKPVANVALIDLPEIRNSVFDDCSFGSWQRHLFALKVSYRLRFRNGCLFEGWGTVPPDGETDGGNAILCFENSNDYLSVTDCHFRNGKWSAMQSQGRYWNVSRNIIEDVCEAGIFIGADSSQFNDNIISRVRCVIVSGNAFEVGGVGNSFSRNTIEDCQNSGIYLTTPHDCSIDANIIRNCAHGGGNAGIVVRSLEGHVTEGLQITSNIITSNTGQSEYAIALYNWGGGPLQNTGIVGNNFGRRDMWTKDVLLAPPDTRGTDFLLANNIPNVT